MRSQLLLQQEGHTLFIFRISEDLLLLLLLTNLKYILKETEDKTCYVD